jgi:N-acetylmuramoyl-L-alanine amidase
VTLRRPVVLLLVAAVLPAVLAGRAAARVHHNDAWARQEFAKAERTREALNGRPAKQRTRHEYQRAIDAYRRVYFGSPASSKADPSVVATAELMVEMGRRFDDDKILRGAVEEYRFLRREYPGSKYRFDALFTIGEIYKDDLNDPEQARKAFEDFLHRYPRNRLAEDARAAVKEMDGAAAQEKERTARTGHAPEGGKEAAGVAANEVANGAANAGGEARRNELPRVTGVRHWSTPDYTRVAIDVEQEVKFNSQRIANPDRIFFDILDTKLASTLVGKTFDVDDGFLKKIRVAEYKPGQTRLVLEVDDLASYDAFLLPDPYRLIIDIHGKQNRAAELAKAHGENAAGTAVAAAGASAEMVASASPDDEASDMTAAPKGKVQTEKEHAIVAKAERSKVGTSKAEKGNTGSPADDRAAAPGTSGVVKTTVAVKGTNRRIPKTIVGPDDDAPSKTARATRGKHLNNAATGTESAANSTGASPNQGDEGVEQAKDSKAGDGKPVVGAREGSAGTADSASGPVSSGQSAAADFSSGASAAKAATTATRRKKSRSASSAAADTNDLEAREARPTAAGNRSLTRALGLKIGKIVIDAGHGGHDTGTIGPDGLLEKDLVLDVAKRLGRLLETRLGAEVIYTRRDDTFIPLETRTAIANRERADLFISIHANSSRDEDARGVETYYLNFTSSPEALEVAARENAVSEKSIHELQDLVKKIALKEKIDESREFASDVQDSLYGGLALRNAGIRNRGVKKAPFIVLIGANMPSILAEISFVSNPTDERKLETSEHRQRIAESLYRGVARYAGGLSGVKVASKIEKTAGQ